MWQRLTGSLLTLAVATLVSFLAVELAPGDRVELLVGGVSKEVSAEALAHIRARQGLDRPLAVRYAEWLRTTLSGRLGVSLKTNRPIAEEFRERIPVSAAVALGALSLGAFGGLGLGLACARYEGRWVDHVIRTAAAVFQSAPAFLMGLAALYLFAFRLGWFPLYGSSGGGLVLPVCVLGAALASSLARVVRNRLLEVSHQEYFLAALGKGLGLGQALFRHGLRNCLTLVITYLGMRFAALLGGVVLIESVFSLPGMGSYVLEAILSRDYPVVQAYLLFACGVVLAANLLADLAVRRADARASQASLI